MILRRLRGRGLAAAVAAMVLNGCAVAATVRSYEVMPNGLERREQALRDLLARADGDQRRLANHGTLPKDRLLRALYEGTLAYYGGDYNAAVKRFELAYELSEDRYTKSLSRGVASLLVNDRELEYLPGENERLFIHYYAALAYLKRNEPLEAAVEARRLVHLLQRFEEKASPRDRQIRAMLRYFAGAVFETAGERNDALVAYRNAALALGDTARARRETLSEEGDLVVVVEQGFVAHRVNQTLAVRLGRDEVDLFVRRDDDRYRRGAFGVATRVEHTLGGREESGLFLTSDPAGLVIDAPADGGDTSATAVPAVPTTLVALPTAPGDATRVQNGPNKKPAKGPDAWIREHILKNNDAAMSETSGVDTGEPRSTRARHADLDDRTLLVSLPAFHRRRSPPPLRVAVGDSVAAPYVSASLSDAVVGDYARQRNAVLARAVARAATRYAVNQAVEKKATKKWGETTGSIVGFLTEAAGNALERADTRSWHLLPERITIVRTRTPVDGQLRVGSIETRLERKELPRSRLRLHAVRDWVTFGGW